MYGDESSDENTGVSDESVIKNETLMHRKAFRFGLCSTLSVIKQ